MKSKPILFLFFISTSCVVQAQFNLKEKLNRKADQVTEDLLFGKKKNKKRGSAVSTDQEGSTDESYEYHSNQESEANDATTLTDYKDKEINWSGVSSNDVVHFSALLSILPNTVDGFRLDSKPEGATMRLGESSYSSATKYLIKDGYKVTLALFDYKEVSSIYASSSQVFSYESTEGKSESIQIDDYSGYFVENYDDHTASVMLFIKDRYMYSASGDNMTKQQLLTITADVKLNKLP